ncbi:hypothetical protein HN446_02510 [bacterium]|nr:hypothetical protein [bacterium]
MFHQISSSRLAGVQSAIAGLKVAGTSLVGASKSGSGFFAVGQSDDYGIYYFVPKIATFLNVSAELAYHLFFYFTLVLSFSIGFFLMCQVFEKLLSRVICFFCLAALFVVTCYVWGVYIFMVACPVLLVSLAIYIFHKRLNVIFLSFLLFLSGVFCYFSHFIRAYSCVAALLFIAIIIFFARDYTRKEKFLLLVFLSFGFACSLMYVKYLFEARDNFLAEHGKNSFVVETEKKHVFWHATLGGLGFVNNEYGIKFDDSTICKYVYKKFPEVKRYPSVEYELAAKKCVFAFIKEKPKFVLFNYFAKLGIIFLYFIIFANIGILCAVSRRKLLILDIAFFVAAVFSSIFGVLTLPNTIYLLGFIAVATLWGMISICFYVEKLNKFD